MARMPVGRVPNSVPAPVTCCATLNDMSTTSVERRGRFRIERVCEEARSAGYSHAWHVFDDDDQDPYVGTFATRAEARRYVRVAILADFPIEETT